MIKVKAVFKGTNSLGYEQGKEYDLLLDNLSEGEVIIKRTDSSGLCLYDSLKAFLRN